jgi:hypothetical protein
VASNEPPDNVPYRLELKFVPNAFLDVVSNQQLERARQLLDSGTDPNLRDDNAATSWPPLALAIRASGSLWTLSGDEASARREMVALLLERGADPNIRWCGDDAIPACDARTGVTPLMYTAIVGDEDLFAQLLKGGADPSLKDWRGLAASEYWGLRVPTQSWCAIQRDKDPLLEDARQLASGETLSAELRNEVGTIPVPASEIAIVDDQRICEAAAVAYARHRLDIDWTLTDPRLVLPVLVVRVGRLLLVDDLRSRDGVAEVIVFSESRRLLGSYEFGS